MSMTDPIADFLTRLRNGAQANKELVDIPASKLKAELARILDEQGYIDGWELEPANAEHPGDVLRVRLKYTEDRKAVITGLKRMSRPGRRVYAPARQLPRVQGGMGTAIVSTSQGVMTGHQARQRGVGGEIVALVW